MGEPYGAKLLRQDIFSRGIHLRLEKYCRNIVAIFCCFTLAFEVRTNYFKVNEHSFPFPTRVPFCEEAYSIYALSWADRFFCGMDRWCSIGIRKCCYCRFELSRANRVRWMFCRLCIMIHDCVRFRTKFPR